ncbi:MAG: PQQ-binding-like beta-propeller repeat protein [Phycisphaerae bacterium]
MILLAVLAVGLVVASAPREAFAGAKDDAEAILKATGVRGGLIVHLATGNDASPDLTAALADREGVLVHGLYADADAVARAREAWRAGGRYGNKVSVARLRGGRLPYAEGTVRLLVADALGPVAKAEVMRVLCPGGVAYVDGKKTVKPVPDEIDEWTHALHDPTNNAVSRDTVVAPPHHLQWVGDPEWARSHDHLSSCSAMVTSHGRTFAIVDEGPAAAVALPAKWRLVARDAYSGVVLWKRVVDPWEGHLRGFRTGPAAIQRRLVAVGDTVYATLGYGKPVTALDAATGETVRTYAETDDALEILCDKGVLYLVLGPGLSHGAARTEHENVGRAEYESPDGKRLTALEADTGKVLWTRDDAHTSHLMPTALAVAGGRVYFQNTTHLVCLDAGTGREQWQADRPVTTSRWAWTAPTLVVHDGVVLSADRDAGSKVTKKPPEEGQVLWVVYSAGGQAPPGKLIAFSAEDGKQLWESKAREAYNAPPDVLVADGLVWTGNLVSGREPGITQGLDPRTGEVKRERPKDQEHFTVGFVHHRCHRNKATERFLVLGRSGVEWIDVKTGRGTADHWVRGACQYGVMPANGLLYAPPHSCACYIEAKLHGFLALAPARESDDAPAEGAGDGGNETEGSRLERGPAFGAPIRNPKSEIRNDDWPTYRHDAARSGRASTQVPADLAPAWQTHLGGEVTSPVVAGGLVFLAQVRTHTLHALDAGTGEVVWSRTLGGRIDSPPTVHEGLCLVGCRDGTVHALRAADGETVWRFRAAPRDRRIVAYGGLESVWPVQGNLLVRDGSAYFAAGRSSYIDGGMMLYKLDPATGTVRAERRLWDRDPESGEEPQKQVRGVYMPGALPDVLSSDGESLYMRHHRFDADLNEQDPSVPHLFAPAGFLDGSWWHRTYFLFGTRMQSGWGGWGRAGHQAPAGRLIVIDDDTVYAFGRLNQYGTAGTHVGLAPTMHPWGGKPKEVPHYVLFSSPKQPEILQEKEGKRRTRRRIEPGWRASPDLWVRGMVLAGGALFLAGPPSPFDGGTVDAEPFAADKPGRLRVVSPTDGKPLASAGLSAPPVWDGLVAARGRLYVATTDGKVTCLKGK